jgi:hypothetical protein
MPISKRCGLISSLWARTFLATTKADYEEMNGS